MIKRLIVLVLFFGVSTFYSQGSRLALQETIQRKAWSRDHYALSEEELKRGNFVVCHKGSSGLWYEVFFNHKELPGSDVVCGANEKKYAAFDTAEAALQGRVQKDCQKKPFQRLLTTFNALSLQRKLRS